MPLKYFNKLCKLIQYQSIKEFCGWRTSSCANFDKLYKLIRYQSIKEFLAYYIGGLYNRISKHHIFLMASGLAFSIFVCIMPMVFIIFAILGMILEKPTIYVEISSFIDKIMPYASQADFIKRLVFKLADEFKIYKTAAGIIGLIGILIASSGLFSSMRTILNMIYKVKLRGNIITGITGKLQDISLVFLVLIYFLFSISILPSFKIVKDFADRVVVFQIFQFGYIEDLATGLASFILIFAAFLTIYSYIPRLKIPKRAIIVSALSAAILWELAKQLFGFYVANVVTLKKIYGAYVLMIMAAFWVYYTSMVFILGAELGQLYRERAAKRKLKPPSN
ncbi:MAG: YihY/virulence factor BrkB family protein [candidate division Zixibacteria bacterium]|nr:YihY/virulence factor BrkB family protein [candidate division Zixibacteria bacterium]